MFDGVMMDFSETHDDNMMRSTIKHVVGGLPFFISYCFGSQ